MLTYLMEKLVSGTPELDDCYRLCTLTNPFLQLNSLKFSLENDEFSIFVHEINYSQFRSQVGKFQLIFYTSDS